MEAPHITPSVRIVGAVVLLYGLYAPIVGSLAAELSGRLTRADRLAAMAGLADRRNRAVPMADPKSTDESRLMSAGATAWSSTCSLCVKNWSSEPIRRRAFLAAL